MKPTRLISPMLFAASLIIFSCNSKKTASEESSAPANTTAPADNSKSASDDQVKGTGKFTNVELTHPLDQKMIAAGQGIYDMKCGSCHKLTEEKLVGPGWKDVTNRRKPEWIMNFVTNTEEMLEKNTEAKNLLEVCMVKMPNQNLSDDDARFVLEFMRKNDGQQ
jgi:cytochrome c2